tara:strand:+ start:2945 stop:4126 length:1182 start_codon:yes stop_codon:yes gene_type:complete
MINILSKIVNLKILNDLLKIYSSYSLFILLSFFSQIYAAKYFSFDNSKLLIFLLATYSWGNFFGEAGYSRYEVSIKYQNNNTLYSIYLRKYLSILIIMLIGNFLLDNILLKLKFVTIIFLMISFFCSSLFVPANLYRRGYKFISYLPNLLFVIYVFGSFVLTYKYNFSIDASLIKLSILFSTLNLTLFIFLNKNLNFNVNKLEILKFANKRINYLNNISYLSCILSILVFFLISKMSESSYYILFSRLIDGINSLFGILALICIKHNLLKRWINIIILSSLIVISILVIFLFLLIYSSGNITLNQFFPIFTYYLVSTGTLFISAAVSQYKKENRLKLLIRINVLLISICALVTMILMFKKLDINLINIVFYMMTLVSAYPIRYYLKLLNKFMK